MKLLTQIKNQYTNDSSIGEFEIMSTKTGNIS